MKPAVACLLVAALALALVIAGHAQAPESIWLAASTASYQVGDTVSVTVNAHSATSIQGFTFRIRYDPACLKAVNTASPIAGMSGLALPQTSGLVDASFASTVPQKANGVLAEVRFLSLTACQTSLVLENAALALRDQYGFAAPLKGIAIGNSTVALQITQGSGAARPTQPVIGTPMPLGVEAPSTPGVLVWALVFVLALVLVGGALFALLRWSRG